VDLERQDAHGDRVTTDDDGTITQVLITTVGGNIAKKGGN